MAIKIGASGQIVKRTTNLPPSIVWSVAAWVKVNSVRPSQYQYFLGAESGTSNANEYANIGYSNTGQFELGAYSIGGQTVNLRPPIIGSWEFFAITNDGTGLNALKVYQKRLGESSLYKTTANGVGLIPALFGFGNDSFDEWCNVEIGEGFVFNRALTEQEVLSIALCGTFPYNGINSHAFFNNSTKVFDTVNPSVSWEIGGTGLTTTFFVPPYLKTFSIDGRLVELSGGATSLTASDLTAQAPNVNTTTISQTHLLTSVGVVGGQPTIDSVVIASIHALIATAPTNGPPLVDTPSVSTSSTLTGSDVVSIIDVESGGLGQTHSVNSDEVEATLVVDVVTISSIHTLTGSSVESQQTDIGSPEIAVSTGLLAAGVSTTIEVQACLVVQTHSFSGSGVESNAVLPPVDLIQTNVLGIENVVSGIPVVDSVTLLSGSDFVVDNVLCGIPTLEVIFITQTHSLGAESLSSGIAAVESATLLSGSDFIAIGVSGGAPAVEIPSITQTHVFPSLNGIESTASVPSLSIFTSFSFDTFDLESAVSIESVEITQFHTLSATEIGATVSIGQSSLSQAHMLLATILESEIPIVNFPAINIGELEITKRTKIIQYPDRTLSVTIGQRLKTVKTGVRQKEI